MKVYEIFTSISGEVGLFPQGSRALFVRFAGCNLRCAYCDAKEAQQKTRGRDMGVAEIVEQIKSYHCRNIVLTGGEPLTQNTDDMEALLNRLNNFKVSMETNGTLMPIKPGAKNFSNVMDYKLHGPEVDVSPYLVLNEHDYIKFVVANLGDLNEALSMHLEMIKRGVKAQFAYSPMIENVITEQGHIKFMCDSVMQGLTMRNLEGIINVQLHKFLGLR